MGLRSKPLLCPQTSCSGNQCEGFRGFRGAIESSALAGLTALLLPRGGWDGACRQQLRAHPEVHLSLIASAVGGWAITLQQAFGAQHPEAWKCEGSVACVSSRGLEKLPLQRYQMGIVPKVKLKMSF